MIVLLWLTFLLWSTRANADVGNTARETTAASPMVKVTTGSSLFFTKHNDPLCQSAPHGVSRDFYVDSSGSKQKTQINSCLQGTDVNFKMTCKFGTKDSTLTKFVYAKVDTTCSNPLVAGGVVYLHPGLCFKGYGVYLKMRCVEDDLLTSLLTKSQMVSPVLYSTKYCTSPTQSIGCGAIIHRKVSIGPSLQQQAHDLGVIVLGCHEKRCGTIMIRKVNRSTVRQQDSHQLCKSKLSRDEQGSEVVDTSGCINASALGE